MLAEQRTPQHSMVREQSYSNSITPFRTCVSILCPPSFRPMSHFCAQIRGYAVRMKALYFGRRGKLYFAHSTVNHFTVLCKTFAKDVDSSERKMLTAHQEQCWKPTESSAESPQRTMLKAHREWCWKPTKSGAECSQRRMLKATALVLITRNFTAY